ncbi:MAG: aldose epimerase family protein [Pseudomonadales bacterium]
MAVFVAMSIDAAEARREIFGELDAGQVEAAVLTNSQGVSARVIAYGAALQSLSVPDRDGNMADVVLSHPDMQGFVSTPQYFGVTAGRYANRIAGGRFSLDGNEYQLPVNNGDNSLHGGIKGFDKVLWEISAISSGDKEASVTFRYVSPDGDQGYPGELTTEVTYALNENNELSIQYRATTTKPTVVNLTNHSYFNLAGANSGQSILNHFLEIDADHFLPTDAGAIPTGELRPVEGTLFDFRLQRTIGERITDGSNEQLLIGRGYDHNYVLNSGVSDQPQLAARVSDHYSGRVLELWTTEPGVQFYSGNFLDASIVGKDDQIYRQSSGFCLEPQHFPDSPNQPDFPSTRLDPGEVYRQTSIFRFSTIP